MMNHPVNGRPMIVGGTFNTYNAEIMTDNTENPSWMPVVNYQSFPREYKSFSFAYDINHDWPEDPIDGIFMFGGEGMTQSEWQMDGRTRLTPIILTEILHVHCM